MKNSRLLLVLVIYLLHGQSSNAQKSAGEKLFNNAIFKHTSVGLSLRDVSTGAEALAFNSEKLLAPASTLKLITSLSALSILGTDFTFSTTLGYTGTIEHDGTLIGNIIIVGGGDPSLGGKADRSQYDLDSWLQSVVNAIKQKGITCIDGDVIVDSKIFANQNIPDQWNHNDIGNYYASGAWGFNINENLYQIYFKNNIKSGHPAQVSRTAPQLSFLNLDCQVITAAPGTGDNAYIYGDPKNPTRVIRGTIPASSSEFVIKGSLPYPPLNAAQLMVDKLTSANLKVGGRATVNIPYQKLHAIIEWESALLSNMVKLANRHSINIYCDAMLRIVGTEEKGDGSINSGLSAINKHLASIGLDTDQIILKDGSGLAVENKITPALMTAFLTKKKEEFQSKVLQWIPQVGKEGTVKSLLAGQSAAKHFFLKSGSIEGVQSYSGFVKAKSGKTYAISLMVNNYTCSYRELKPQLEKILLSIYNNY